jgi:hypothetical protein
MAFTIQHTSTAFGYPSWYHVGGDADYQAAAKKAYQYAMQHGGYVCVKDADGKTCFGTDPAILSNAITSGRNRDFPSETARRQGCCA